ncbi:MAG: hypothetical protein UR61_C0033G0003 [candidate division WS6 bacterium GW2011_GWE1_34_7]|uniref:Purple acid phosphatase N-terminal domain-containing protein n=1 Tax=candidate division WS6 bacterium GW2011_GWE1_34_7 TaxID=1619093 RepID=A0A0G0B713_9BACT|nr:MAG: hypothetical protein UR61_C0033G0003 [candidate division WS6 bacterium GW2011_GWE1_34_7]
MGIQTVKVLRTISKIVLLIVGIAIIGYGGLMVYKSVINKPQRVRITNITDSAATITWVTDNPVRGVVYYKDEGTFLPGPLGLIGSKVAYDDRDFANAQSECVAAFNENAKNTKDANFTVEGRNFDCENIPVENLGAYFTHSVTIKNLNESGTYFFVVGNGIWSWSVDGVDKTLSENDLAVTNSFNFKTSKLLEEVPTPNIAYGTVYAGVKSEEGYLSESLSKDSLVFAYLTINGVNSQTISAVTNIDGGWTFDKSNFRDTEGNLIIDLSNAQMFMRAQYEDVKEARWIELEESLSIDTEIDLQGNLVDDLDTEEKGNILEKLEILIGKVYAVGPDKTCLNQLPIITDDSTYTCNKDCDTSYSVSGCGVGSSCMKKCTHVVITKHGMWENRDWVVYGTVPGTCNPPANFCGECANGNVQNDSTACKHRNCVAGNWSAWQNGLSDGSSCSSGDDESDQCSTNGACNDVSAGHQICVSHHWGPVLSGSCPPVELNESCEKNGQEIPHGGCFSDYYCNDGALVKVANQCGYTGSSSTPIVNEEKCTLEPIYTTTDCGVGSCLQKCVLTCNDGPKDLGRNHCMDLAPSIKPELYGEAKNDPTKFAAVGIDMGEMGRTDLKLLLNVAPDLRPIAKKEMEKLITFVNNWKCGDATIEERNSKFDEAKKLCNLLDGKWKAEAGEWCLAQLDNEVAVSCPMTSASSMPLNLLQKSYAQDSASDGYTLYLPEYGMYSFQLGDYQLTTNTSGGNTYHIFYIETNDKAGFQMPADPDNPTPDEDIMLKSSSTSITYEKVSSAQSYTLVKGINLVSFNFIPVSTDLGPLTAKGVIDEAAKKGVTIQYISAFEGGRWAKGYTCKSGKCSGNDFNILPGKGYLVFATKGGEMAIPGYNLKSSVPVNLSGGWNLVGVHGYTTAYTARTLIDSMSKIDGVTANNVTWWPTSKGMYEGLQVTGEQQYGFDFPISPTNGYFVRISSFKPKDTKCKSLLWNEGGTLNGSCGIIK